MKIDCLTINRPIELAGVGLHSGKTVHVTLLPKNTPGIECVRSDIPGAEPLTADDVDGNGPPLRTRWARGSVEVYTVEHFLSLAQGMGLWALTVEVDGAEMPGLDGSARDITGAVHSAGLHAIDGTLDPIIIRDPVKLGNESAWIAAEPTDGFDGLTVQYELFYPDNPLAQGTLELEITPEAYVTQIAPARTFCLKSEAEQLRAMGFGKGASVENTLVIDRDVSLGTVLRFEDEPVRHKILDMLGDLYMARRPIIGRVTGYRSGHALNREMAVALAGIAGG